MAASKAQKMLSLIKIAFKHLQPLFLCVLYKAFVRPLLDYCIPAWSPYYVKDIEALEKVQRRMTRMLPDYRHLSYLDRLQVFKLTTLKTRRLRYDLICVFKILNGFLDVDPSHFFVFNVRPSRSHDRQLYVSYSRLDARKNFFSQRIISFWNELPVTCVMADSVLSFKRELDSHLCKMGFV